MSIKDQQKSIDVVLGNRKVDILSLLEIDESDLANEFAQQAALYGWVGHLTAEAEYNASVAKHQTEIEYASADDNARFQMDAAGEKTTEGKVRAAIDLDEQYIEARQEENRRWKEYKTLRSLSDALKMRADMLISMGAHLRAEQEMTGMKINTDKWDKAVDNLKKTIKDS